jgi:hypothetical protein
MALTLEKAKRLERAGLTKHFSDNKAAWTAAAKDAYLYMKKGFAGEAVRPDDVVPPLKAVVEIDKSLRVFLDKKKLSQKYWIADFTDLVIDSTWNEIAED